MIDEICLNTLVCNVVAKNRFSHCRLCLCLIQDHYVRFTDKVSLDTEKNIFQPLSEVLMKLLGQNVSSAHQNVFNFKSNFIYLTIKLLLF